MYQLSDPSYFFIELATYNTTLDTTHRLIYSFNRHGYTRYILDIILDYENNGKTANVLVPRYHWHLDPCEKDIRVNNNILTRKCVCGWTMVPKSL